MHVAIGNSEYRAYRCGVTLRIGRREWHWNRIERRLSHETVGGSRAVRRHWTWDSAVLQPKPAEFWRKPGCTYFRIGRKEWVWMHEDSPTDPDTVLRKIRMAIFRADI